MNKYRKVIVAGVGLVLIVANDIFGLTVNLDAGQIADVAVAIMTAIGVWGTPNDASVTPAAASQDQ